jgi:linoleoyl-CoA desaturase
MPVPAKLTFAPTTPFQTEVKQEVDAYFTTRGIPKTANAAMYAKTVFWLAYTWGTWAWMLAAPLSFPLQLLQWALFGFGLAAIGFNVGHDAIHGAFSERPWVNRVFGWSFDMMGASSGMWAGAHNFVHHTYTNVAGVDDDIEPGPALRFFDRPDVKPWHRFQHLYCWFLYPLVGVLWVYHKDYMLMLRVDPRTGKRASPAAMAGVLTGKALHYVLLLVIPLLVLPNPAWQIVMGYFLSISVGGFTLAIVFQLAHAVEGVVAPVLEPGATKVSDGWADHQMKTTANFGTTWLATFVTGGLDHQIEHHLFPRISHVHYPKLSPIVKAVALKHGLPYVHNGSFPAALGSHYRAMRRFGRAEGLHLRAEPIHAAPPMTPQHAAAAE